MQRFVTLLDNATYMPLEHIQKEKEYGIPWRSSFKSEVEIFAEEAKKRFPKELLFKYTMVPLDTFGDIVTVAMPVMLSFEDIAKIQKDHHCDLFPYVGLITENKKVLGDMHKDYAEWVKDDVKRREEDQVRRKAAPKKPAGDWMSIFDAGDQAIQQSKKRT